jgi:DNA-binding transcriptional LysR family regulator
VLTAARSRPSGRLTITASVMLGRLHVAPLASEFLKRHRDVSAELVLLDRVVDLVEEEIDVGVRIGLLPDSSLHALEVGTVRRVVCASPSHLKRCGVPKQPDDLHRHTLIHFSGLDSAKLLRFVDDGREHDVAITPRWASNSA